MKVQRSKQSLCKYRIESKTSKGITLIALVITIIVLLILAGITISFLMGDNGILNKAIKAREETENGASDEINRLNNIANIFNAIENKKPIIETLEISGMNEDIIIKAKARDEDKEELTYKIYLGNDENDLKQKDIKENVREGTEVLFYINRAETFSYIKLEVIDRYTTAIKTLGINGKPKIEKAEVIDISKTGIKALIKGTDEKSEKLIYKIYMGTDENNLEEKATSEEVNQGTELELTTNGLSIETTYYYKIEITNGIQMQSTEIAALTTLSNEAPQIADLNVTRGITVASNPENSTSWIQVSTMMTDTDDESVNYKIYLGTSSNLTDANIIKDETLDQGSNCVQKQDKLKMATMYYYKVVADDGYETATRTGTITSLCSGTVSYCKSAVKCSGCSGTGTCQHTKVSCTSWSSVGSKLCYACRKESSSGASYYTFTCDKCELSLKLPYKYVMGVGGCPECGANASEQFASYSTTCAKCRGGKYSAACSAHSKNEYHYYCSHNSNGVQH